jgi:hypothetical protein
MTLAAGPRADQRRLVVEIVMGRPEPVLRAISIPNGSNGQEETTMGGAVKREWIEAAQRERHDNGAKAVARWDDEGGASVTAIKEARRHAPRQLAEPTPITARAMIAHRAITALGL